MSADIHNSSSNGCDSHVLRLNHHGPGWIPSIVDCVEINVACDHFFAIRGMTFLTFADRIKIEIADSK